MAMILKICNLLLALLLLSSCTTEEIDQDTTLPVDGSTISLSFSVDAPNAAEITKATGGDTEKGVEELYLYTFDEDGSFLSPVVKAEVKSNGYSAVIQKTTRTIHFVANDGTLLPTAEDAMASLPTEEQIFWAKRTFNEIPNTDLSNNLEREGSNIELVRNWAKINFKLSFEASTKLSDVSYLIYNESKKASVGYIKEGSVNVPKQDFYKPAEGEAKFSDGGAIYTFEHSNQDKDGAFVIVKAKFENNQDFTYYKIDLAVKDGNSHVTKVYDFVRNYAFNITIESVSRKGMVWADVINPDVIADNNITASPIMEKYPNITYDGESLIVTKTTYVFTGKSNKLEMQATYIGKGQLSVSPDPDQDMSNVVKGELKYPSEISSGSQTITITADIQPSDNGEEVAYFYVVGGNLQRKIKLILRPPYNFINPRFENQENASGANLVDKGQGKDVWLKFSLGDVEEALYPIECRIYTKKLYAVEPGVRLETGGGNWYYVYTAQTPSDAERVIQFKTNSQNEAESDVLLEADLYQKIENLAYKRDNVSKMSGKMTSDPKLLKR